LVIGLGLEFRVIGLGLEFRVRRAPASEPGRACLGSE